MITTYYERMTPLLLLGTRVIRVYLLVMGISIAYDTRTMLNLNACYTCIKLKMHRHKTIKLQKQFHCRDFIKENFRTILS